MSCLLFLFQNFGYTTRQAWMPPDTLTMQSPDCVTGVLGGTYVFCCSSSTLTTTKNVRLSVDEG